VIRNGVSNSVYFLFTLEQNFEEEEEEEEEEECQFNTYFRK
jgi:hypothetical protein